MKKQKINAGDEVEVVTNSEVIKGMLMPQTSKNIISVKLGEGYNIGIEKKKIKSTKVVNKSSSNKKISSKIKVNKKLPTISILHTGGTIASVVDYKTGGVVPRFSAEEMIDKFLELKEIANINSRLISSMLSENMRFEHYNLMAKAVEKEIRKGVNGVIITHGTDTLHYSAAALSFILEDLPVPVILVGAQRSSDRPSSDAGINLIGACLFITKTDFAAVAICMHENMSDKTCVILPALKTRKMHTSRRDAFRPVNSMPIAHINPASKNIAFLVPEYRKKQKTKLKLRLLKPKLKIGILKSYPGMCARQVDSFKGFDGVVLEGTGLGHLPVMKIDKYTSENSRILESVKRLVKAGTIVVMGSQTIYGRVNMMVYSPGRMLIEAGVLGNYLDMTPETMFIKLAWLLSNFPKEKVKELVGHNFRGELDKRSPPDEFLI